MQIVSTKFGCLLAAVVLLATAGAARADMDGPARERPMDDITMLEFLDTAIHARVIDRTCPEIFDKEEKSLLYLAYRWGRSVSTSEAYPVQLYLTAIQSQKEYLQALEDVDCTDAEIIGLAESFDPFFAAVPDTVRTSEIR